MTTSTKLAPWGLALENLRKGQGMTKADMSRHTDILKDQYFRMCHSKLGPSVVILHRWLIGMGLTWQDWAEEFTAHAKGSAILTMGQDKRQWQKSAKRSR